ncbi:MAG: Veg family protein [Firmicutes bacterium]|nr:Veg family protein [Bacillota bacterium]MCL5040196.1 Veg family protein [Bacillota bacterium]
MAPKNILLDIRNDLEPHVGERIKVRANRGRRKFLEQEGILERTYPSIFVIKFEEADNRNRRLSFSYTDVLTDSVQLIVRGEKGDRKIEASLR